MHLFCNLSQCILQFFSWVILQPILSNSHPHLLVVHPVLTNEEMTTESQRYNCFTRNTGNAIPKHAGPESKFSKPTAGLPMLWVRNPLRGNFNQVSRKEAGRRISIFVKLPLSKEFTGPLQFTHLFCNLSKFILLFFSCISSLILLASLALTVQFRCHITRPEVPVYCVVLLLFS